MRTILFLVCIFLQITVIDNSQCAYRPDILDHCGCCPLIGGSCVYYDTIDGMDVSWHLCVPDSRKKHFSLKECKPNIIMAENSTRICHTKDKSYRLFPQCSVKEVCFLPIPPRNYTSKCGTEMTVKGSCKNSKPRFSYDSKRRECVPFTYSGCGGTTNRFIRKDLCEKLCKKST